MPQTKASIRRKKKGNDRRFKRNRNDGTLGPSGPSGCRGAEQQPDVQLRDNEAPLADQIEEIPTLPFHRVQHIIKAFDLPEHVELQGRAIELALTRLLDGRTPKPGSDLGGAADFI